MIAGEVLVIQFKNDSFTSFVEYCLSSKLISGVHVKPIGESPNIKYILFLYVTAPGVDRLEKAISDYGAEIVF